MILQFPDLETLRITLTNGAVPAAISQTPASVGCDEHGTLWLQTELRLPARVQDELRILGVSFARQSKATVTTEVSCWPEILPLQRDPSPLPLGQSTILFDVADGKQLAKLSLEMLRLGTDRQNYRWLEQPQPDGTTTTRGLLRVVAPPYYSLLRALEGQQNLTAYLERAPRLWVQLGFVHPLLQLLCVPEGQLLLVRSPAQWTYLPEQPFRDMYEVMEFHLPRVASTWQEAAARERLRVSLSLTAAASTEPAELWVLREHAFEELNHLVQHADDALLRQLAFAIGEQDGQKVIVLRVRPSKPPPPILVVKGEAFRPFLRLPNLFLPVGKRLHPPLRRDSVRKLLAENPNTLVWLASGTGNSFTPESLPLDAFRPLTDWVDYVIEHHHRPLQEWVQVMRFEFESFVCTEDDSPRPKQPPDPKEKKRSGPSPAEPSTVVDSLPNFPTLSFSGEGDATERETISSPDLERIVALQKALREVESHFLALDGPLDLSERQSLWERLANLNSELSNRDDACLSWLNCLWFHPAQSSRWAARWFRDEASQLPSIQQPGTPAHTWASRLIAARDEHAELDRPSLIHVLDLEAPTGADVRTLAAYVVWMAGRTPAPPILLEHLHQVQRFLEQHESLLPVRAMWLVWLALAQLAGQDILALARARDRLLERLFQQGLRPEQELPSFLRYAGLPTSQRFRSVRQWLADLCPQAQGWSRAMGSGNATAKTSAYLDLLFAYGLARLGESEGARKLQEQAAQDLNAGDQVHQFLYRAFAYRIKRAQEGFPLQGPLPQDLLDDFSQQMQRLSEKQRTMPTYLVDRLRQRLRLLEPDQKINPHARFASTDLDKALVALTQVTDREGQATQIRGLLKTQPLKGSKNLDPRRRILLTALNLAPRLGEDFAQEMLGQSLPTYDAMLENRDTFQLEEQAALLERGLFVAAHFDRTDSVQQLIVRFQQLLQLQRGPTANLEELESLAENSFRNLRKLGMQEEIGLLLRQLFDQILEGRDLNALNLKADRKAAVALRLLLHVAAGWYYFGQDRQAEPILQAVRSLLFSGALVADAKDGRNTQARLARVYALTVGQGPVEIAHKRLEELFHNLKGLTDTWTTNTHYSLMHLELVEAVVLSVVNDDMGVGADARRWLDDDEFIVRRRVHQDFQRLKSQTP